MSQPRHERVVAPNNPKHHAVRLTFWAMAGFMAGIIATFFASGDPITFLANKLLFEYHD